MFALEEANDNLLAESSMIVRKKQTSQSQNHTTHLHLTNCMYLGPIGHIKLIKICK